MTQLPNPARDRTDMPDLLPCPFCDGRAELFNDGKTTIGKGQFVAHVECSHCENVSGGYVYEESRAEAELEAINSWNSRPCTQPDQPSDESRARALRHFKSLRPADEGRAQIYNTVIAALAQKPAAAVDFRYIKHGVQKFLLENEWNCEVKFCADLLDFMNAQGYLVNKIPPPIPSPVEPSAAADLDFLRHKVSQHVIKTIETHRITKTECANVAFDYLHAQGYLTPKQPRGGA